MEEMKKIKVAFGMANRMKNIRITKRFNLPISAVMAFAYAKPTPVNLTPCPSRPGGSASFAG
jgi:hypothetical protein